ncbi:DUF3369 domain-containing protein [Leeia aquatica]|uniref:DUF3369 domain-containing protein n=1 Tax=Leeia aquatica TaxID=2725557 RepID=A0A847RU95_9NEIS|nr:DUF3369 domain-containing protein [Leeia aquatica]NLR74780.1 DUF3369 domain-containing protein [Leeia aquatica]
MSMPDEDDWLIEDEEPGTTLLGPSSLPWVILIVDDEPDVHSVTRLAMQGVSYKRRNLQFISAYSGAEGFEVLSSRDDVALVLLDVVMETDDAGLRLVRRIREELQNALVRIVLRTGQPGQAPEQQVITDYDINDYKAKTELTSQKLFTTVIASLRAYESLLSIERSRQGLGKILDASANLYQKHSLREFASGVLRQISGILGFGADGVLCVSVPPPIPGKHQPLSVVAATEAFETLLDTPDPHIREDAEALIQTALQQQAHQFAEDWVALYIATENQREYVICFAPPWPLAMLEQQLLRVFCDRISAAFDNLYLYEQLKRAQTATVVALADLAEFRDTDTGEHVLRVQGMTDAIVAELQALGYYSEQLTLAFVEQVGMASILHDVGKVGTPDHILFKPGKHDEQERGVMQQHASTGGSILGKASDMVDGVSYLSLACEIAGNHHEHWDGSGYPQHLQGEAIPLSARIAAVSDVFDALMHKRPYKEPWTLEAAVQYIQARAGSQFDPKVVEAFLQVIHDRFPDLDLSVNC